MPEPAETLFWIFLHSLLDLKANVEEPIYSQWYHRFQNDLEYADGIMQGYFF